MAKGLTSRDILLIFEHVTLIGRLLSNANYRQFTLIINTIIDKLRAVNSKRNTLRELQVNT